MLRVGMLILTVLSVSFTVSHSARILGLFPSHPKSHLIIHMNTIRPMIERGHDVTIVTAIPVEEPNLKFRHIKLDQPDMDRSMISQKKKGLFEAMESTANITNNLLNLSNLTINNPEMQKLMREESFDLVVLGYFFNDFLIGIAGHFKCPLIINWMGSPLQHLAKMMGNPSELSYVPDLLTGLQQPMGFFDRVINYAFSAVEHGVFHYVNYRMGEYYAYNFPPDKYPSYEDMKKNVSLLFVNTYLSQGYIQPNVPTIIQIGGIQIKPKPDPLPQDIKEFIDSAAETGVIYFCLGSNIGADFLTPDFINIIFKVLSGVKQNVIWKWDKDELPGESPNILYKKWLPQDDILAHPNLKLFITHAGGGGVAEAQYHGVPMVAIPFFADQFSNANKLQKAGHGIVVDKGTLTEDLFRKAVLEVLENTTYTDSVKTFSRIFRDRPLSARDTAAYWMEYVLRHKGAKHLQSPAIHMNAIQYYGLDVIAFLIGVAYVVCKESVAHTIPDGEEKALIRRIDNTVLQNITRRSDLPTNAERVMQAICGTREKVSAFT
ncbi:unnamed protein product [Hermetia illucens]|uniref:UDP-glycosyltransferase n=1 Tax=Hermetia illucens TaxID=343691 RepID=A0A7R8UCJ0_HERIL|nr:unnamed protein product [Hermetia illucens]